MPRKRRRRRSRRSRGLRRLALFLTVGGALSLGAALSGGYYILRHFDLTPRQFVLAAAEKSGVEGAWVRGLVGPSPAFSRHRFDGFLRDGHPRILFPDLANATDEERLAMMEVRKQAYEDHGIAFLESCGGGGVMGQAACWYTTGNEDLAKKAVAAMVGYRLNKPNPSGEYGNGWKLAFAYDFLAGYDGFGDDAKALVRKKIRQALWDYLVLLNGDSASLWHGRATLAAQAWLCAVVLDPDSRELRDLITQAQAHFLNVVRALELTEAWPEGYNYWINNRAFPLALAGAAYLNGLNEAVRAEEIRALFNRIGLWHLYATRPDNRIEGFGDEGPRVDLKDETRRVMDIIASMTRNSLFVRYSRFLGQLHGRDSYFEGYRWGFRLFNDPTVPRLLPEKKASLDRLDDRLPRAEIFGERALNLAYIRSGWGRDDTFISFRGGHSFTHHGHYDAGHFTLFKGAPLAVTSGTYGRFFGEHRLNYYIRTVAKNSLLILRPDETVRPNRHFKPNVAAGGQRIVLPTGSAITSPGHWMENRGSGQHLEGGQLLAFHYEDNEYAYIAVDLTPAYNNPVFDTGGFGGKVSKVVRELLYLYPEDRLLVHDHVVSTRAGYRKKWLLHTVERPDMEGLRVLKGNAKNGILETGAAVARVANGRGRLRLDRVYPEDAVMRLVGGPDYRFYVETDGDDADLDGKNMQDGANLKPWFDTGAWRIEVQPGGDRLNDHFLHVLSPGLDKDRPGEIQPLALGETDARGVITPDSLAIFSDRRFQGRLAFDYAGDKKSLYVLGLPSLAVLKVNGKSYSANIKANDAGTVMLDLTAVRPGRMELAW